MIIVLKAEKMFDKIHYPFLIKNPQQSSNRRELPESDKGHLQVSYR